MKQEVKDNIIKTGKVFGGVIIHNPTKGDLKFDWVTTPINTVYGNILSAKYHQKMRWSPLGDLSKSEDSIYVIWNGGNKLFQGSNFLNQFNVWLKSLKY